MYISIQLMRKVAFQLLFEFVIYLYKLDVSFLNLVLAQSRILELQIVNSIFDPINI